MDFLPADHSRDLQEQNMHLQGELIHVLWGYHVDRLKNGHPPLLGNNLHDKDSANLDKPNHPRVLIRNIQRDGILPFDIQRAMRAEPNAIPTQIIAHAIIASIWDSINHLIDLDRTTALPQYTDFLNDEELAGLREEMDSRKDYLFSYTGTNTMHSGARVGIGIMADLAALKYGLPSQHPFDVERLSHVLSKTGSMGLMHLTHMNLMMDLAPDTEKLGEFLDPQTSLGMPVDTIRKICNRTEIGCPSRQPISPRAQAILERHGMFEGAYGIDSRRSAIFRIAGHVRELVFAQMDEYRQSLTPEECAARFVNVPLQHQVEGLLTEDNVAKVIPLKFQCVMMNVESK